MCQLGGCGVAIGGVGICFLELANVLLVDRMVEIFDLILSRITAITRLALPAVPTSF